jgi:alkanesulfonate monooxygenase SsuD/methylene tetrahydromethanopterin reductase-like flavin-dependent oxidoreductase (luciferase family)
VDQPRLAVRVGIDAHGVLAAALGEFASTAESAGAEALFVSGERSAAEANDPFVLLGAAAGSTSRIGLGCLSLSIDERQPAILAKSLASLDLCSNGRAVACVSSDFTTQADAAGVLVEAVAVVRAMLEVAAPTFHGEHFSVTRAWNEPRMERDRPLPIGVELKAVSADPRAGPLQAAQLAVALIEHVDFVVAAWNEAGVDRPTAGIPALALVDASNADIKEVATAAFRAPNAGVVLDFCSLPEPGELSGALAIAKQARRSVDAESR